MLELIFPWPTTQTHSFIVFVDTRLNTWDTITKDSFKVLLKFLQGVTTVHVHTVLSISRSKNPGMQVPVIMLAINYKVTD
jgi:hypothetical protein